MLDQMPVVKVITETVQIPSDMGMMIGKLYAPDGPADRAVLINGATGVPQKYYRDFAKWLAAERNMFCLTYDYRDFGASRRGDLRGSEVDMAAWGLTDQQSARDYLCNRFPELSLTVIGHSLGGMMLPFQQNLDRIDRVITVASGAVHYRHHPWPYQALARIFWFGPGPVFTSAFGYLPGTKLGFGADLPAEVYWQWRRWCTSETFYFGDIGTTLPEPNWPGHIPVKMVQIADDQVCPSASIDKLSPEYGTPVQRAVIDPVEIGTGPIGHLSAFTARNAAAWPEILK